MIFPRWTNLLGPVAVVTVIIGSLASIFVIWYWLSDNHLTVGYQPVQPIKYSHKLHVTDLGMDCRYCHTGAEVSPVAGVPSSDVCMGCHNLILPASPEIMKLKQYQESGMPVPWKRVHKLPEYAYFDHSVHINKGVGCVSCHGRVDQMAEVRQEQSLSMSWCLDCHKAPEKVLREKHLITAALTSMPNQIEQGKKLLESYHINTRIDCSACHR
ncbi:MAG: cytochrome c3 family protein [Fibrobacteria bacterium]|nr:cytochrome c3 family protein [Fibrobacteria bacterium]